MGSQLEFPYRVAVCAWCKPGELGEPGSLSHGICPRHLHEVLSEIQPTESAAEPIALPLPETDPLQEPLLED